MDRTPQELGQLGDQGQPERLISRRTHALIARLIALNQPDTRTITPRSPEGSGITNNADGDPGHAAKRSPEHKDSAATGDHVDHRRNIPEILASIQRSLYALDIQNATLSHNIQFLENAMPSYIDQRNCFLSTFKRDKLGRATPEDLRVIEEEYLVAYGGNARLDANLYGMDGERTDIETFEKLYGVLPETVERISCIKTIAALDTHAGVVASNSKTGSDKFYRLFWEFVRLLKEYGAGYHEGYLDCGPRDLENAFHAFMSCIKTEVTVVGTRR